MNMDSSYVTIVDLSDEMLLNIMNKLNNIDVLYSLIDVNDKLDKIACDITFTRCIDLITMSPKEKNYSKLSRFCSQILPRISNKIECLMIDGYILEQIPYVNTYFNLRKVILIDIDVEMASNVFNDVVFYLY